MTFQKFCLNATRHAHAADGGDTTFSANDRGLLVAGLEERLDQLRGRKRDRGVAARGRLGGELSQVCAAKMSASG